MLNANGEEYLMVADSNPKWDGQEVTGAVLILRPGGAVELKDLDMYMWLTDLEGEYSLR